MFHLEVYEHNLNRLLAIYVMQLPVGKRQISKSLIKNNIKNLTFSNLHPFRMPNNQFLLHLSCLGFLRTSEAHQVYYLKQTKQFCHIYMFL